MGLLSILFKKKYVDSKEFPIICFKLSSMLESIRKEWIGGCKTILEAQAEKSLADIIIDEGPIDTLSKAFQMLISSKLVADKSYVIPSETKAFADLLYSEVFKDELMQCLECVKAYEKYQRASQINHQVSTDLAHCFLGKAASEEEISYINSTMSIFTVLTQMVTADIFADYKSVKKKELSALKLLKNQDEFSFINYELLKDAT